jgi:hypothetical protein
LQISYKLLDKWYIYFVENIFKYETDVFSNKITETKGKILHSLTTWTIIHDYENGLLDNDQCENELIKKQSKQDLIKLNIKHSIVSSFTSFVAIEERDGEIIQPGRKNLNFSLNLNNLFDFIKLLNYFLSYK